jgi:hypothetical protein
LSDADIRAVGKILDFSFAQSAIYEFSAQKAALFAGSANHFARSFFMEFSPESLNFTLTLRAATYSHAVE